MITSRRGFSTMLAGGVVGVTTLAASKADAQGEAAPGSTLQMIRSNGVLRVAGYVGAAPYFKRDLASGEWSGAAVEMSNNIAKVLGVKVEFVEATYQTAILDLKAGRSDMAYALNPTGERALSIGFTYPFYRTPYSFLVKEGFAASSWPEVDKPETKIACIIGTLAERLARRFAPQAEVTTFKDLDSAVVSLQMDRSHCVVSAALQALNVEAKNKMFRTVPIKDPVIAPATAIGIRQDPTREWENFLNAWVTENRYNGQIFEWLANELVSMGVPLESIPADV